ncbi:TRAP transporter small permease subunit [Pseudooceanicola sediminis]|uniref:TRAP transporter small permease protein n=1 Tax=Pseudooceanicola sediminis TaxID=2211117 RepID=A0A399J0H0_9RHOB|nr:TRAP transporter small permease subunit [Pseudooceanicola sediminis]KAA2315052.1 TRAP transporter small permease subunit [Puniceibacterium sp. HSS470]RII38865.1 TRAP transporter small permease subunit [Pseudooceanicola sediminis]|tara:strand:- start:56049 stop:56567 length:519 start_codon:yes stop_codon:yes gene_type:complete
MSALRTGRAVLARLTELGVGIGMALLALMATIVVVQVGARNLLDLGLPWADELARFSGIGMVFLSIPALASQRVLVSVTMVPDMLGRRAQMVSAVISDLSVLVCAGLLLWSFAAFLPRAGKFLTPALQLPNYFYYSLALIGTALLAVVMAFRMIELLTGRLPELTDPVDIPQ